MANSKRINYTVGFSVDKSGLNELQSALQKVYLNTSSGSGPKQLTSELKIAGKTAQDLEKILQKSYNPKMNSINMVRFNKDLKDAGYNAEILKKNLSYDKNGAAAFNLLGKTVMNTNTQIVQTNKLLDKMGETLGNTIRWSITSSLINSITGSIQKAYTYTKQLDTSLNNIRIVTGKSAEEMDKFADKANEAAKALGASTLDYTKASLIYYQQGLSDEEVQARAETTVKVANITGQTGDAVSEQLTSVWNGYKVSAQETEQYIDKLAAVAATTASDLKELSVGMSKVASAANAMGVDFDDLNAQIATIVSVTRQAPESVGTALKTIYARLGDLKVDGVDEFGVKLGEVSSQLQTMGIQILDANGDMRDMTSVMTEVAEKWNTWTRAQQQAAAVAMAGKRQYNNLVALFENWDMYSDALETSKDSLGTLQEQQDVYMESTAAKLKTLKATSEGLYKELFNQDELKKIIPVLTSIVDLTGKVIKNFGGGIKSIAAFAMILTNVFSQQIGRFFTNLLQQQATIKRNADIVKTQYEYAKVGVAGEDSTKEARGRVAGLELQYNYTKQIYAVRKSLDQESASQLDTLRRTAGSLEEQLYIEKATFDEIAKKNNIEQEYIDKIKEEYSVDNLISGEIEDVAAMEDQGNLRKIEANKEINKIVEERKKILQEIKQLEDESSNKKIFKENFSKGLDPFNQKGGDESTTAKARRNALKENSANLLSYAEENGIKIGGEDKEKLKNIANLPGTVNSWDRLKELGKEYEQILDRIIKKNEQFKDNSAQVEKKEEELQLLQQEEEKQRDIITQSERETEQYNEKVAAMKQMEALQDSISKHQMELTDTTQTFDDIIRVAQQGTNIINVISGISSAVTTLTMAINSLNTLVDVWSDKEKNFGEKMLQTVMTLGMTIPMLITSFDKLNTALGSELTLSNLVTLVRAKRIALNQVELEQKKKELIIQKLISKGHQQENIDIAMNIAAEAAKKEATEEEIRTEIKQQLLKEFKHKLSLHEIRDLYQMAAATTGYTAASTAANVATKTLNQTLKSSPWGWILLAVGLLIGALTSLVTITKKNNDAKKELLQKDLDEIKANQELIEQHKELYKSYNDLYLKYQETKEGKDELLNKTLELVDAYGVEGGKILALAGDYEAAYQRINAARKNEIEQNLANAQEGAVNAAEKLARSGRSGRGQYKTKDNIYKMNYDLWDADNLNDGINDIYNRSSFEYAGLDKYIDKEHNFSLELDLDTEEGQREYLKYIEGLNDFRKHYASIYNKDNGNSKWVKKELKDYDDEDIKTLKEQLSIIDKERIALDFLNIQYDSLKKNIKDDQELFNQTYERFDQIREKYKNNSVLSNQEIYKEIQEQMNLLNIDQDTQLKIQLMFEFTDNIDKGLPEKEKEKLTKEFEDFIQNLSTEELAFVEVHLNTNGLTEDLKKWVEENSDILSFIKKKGQQQNYYDILTKYDSSKGFSTEDIDSMYKEEGSSINGLSQSSFESLDKANQLTEVTLAYINQTKAIEADKEAILKKLQAERDSLEITEEEEKVAKNYDTAINLLANSNEELKGKEEAIKDVLALAGDETVELTDDQKLLLSSVERQAKIMDVSLDEYKEHYKAQKDLQERITYLENEISKITSTELDYAKALEEVNQIQKEHNTIIDDAQSAYKSLSSMVENYNSTHAWTIDDVQTLMTMSDQYVAQLDFENGQLSLNEEGFRNLTVAKLQDMLVTAQLQYELEMEKLAQIAEGDANDYAAQREQLHIMRLEALGLVAEGTADRLNTLAASMKKIDKYGSPELIKAAEEKTKAFNNKKKALEEAIEQAKNGNFGSLMGASSKSSGKDKDKTFEDEFDRYWEFKKAIDMLDKSMARLQKTQSKLHGKELIDSLKKENELLEQQKANYDALLHAQEREAGELQGKLDYFGATFADNGELTNYADVTKKMLDAYTSGTVSEKAYEDFKKALERYDSLYYSEIQDTLDKLDDARRKQLENNLKGWETEIQIKLDLTEAERNWNDFVRDLEQDFRKIYEDLTIESAFDTKNFETYNDDLNTTLQAINDVENEITKLASTGRSDMFESMSEAQEKLKDLGNQLIENGKSLYELYESVWDNYINKLDQAADNLKDINDEFGHITNELEYEKKLIELIYGDKAYDKMTKYYDAQQKNINMQIDSLKTQRDFWEDQFQAAYMMNKDEHNVILNDMSTWTEDMRKAYDQMIESQESLNDKITEGIENLTDNYLNKLAETFDKLENAVWNMNLDALSDDWDRITGLADEYLDDVEGAYEIQNLANQIDKDINNTSDIKAAQRLQAFREKEIAILREKDNLTQDDVDLAEARYQIMLKEIALEDAQNAKNSMKLTRNTSGNWTYQYVADDEDVADKRQDLLQSYQNLYKMADDAYQHAMELATGSYQEMQDKIREIAEDTTLAEEEKMLKIQEIQDTYLPMIEAAVENSELYRQEAITATGAVFEEVCEQDADAYQYLTDLQKELVDGVRDKHLEDYEAIRSAVVDGVYPEIAAAAQSAFLETNLNSSTAAADVIHQWADDDGESVKAKLNDAIDSIEDNVKEFEDELNIMKEVAGEDFGNVDKEIQNTIDWLNKMGNKTSDMTKKSTDQLDIMRTAVNELGLKFEELTEKIFETAQKMAEYKEATAAAVEEMIKLNIEKSKFDGTEYTAGYGPRVDDPGSTTESKRYKLQSDPYGASGTMGLYDTQEKKWVKITDEKIISADSDLYGVNGNTGLYVNGTLQKIGHNVSEKDLINKYIENLFGVSANDIDLNGFVRFASGGYTGDWDTSGRLAVLHQKELVLNEDDTSNFLKATSLLRDISKINGSIEDSIMTSILGMMNALNPRIGGFSASPSGSQESNGNIFNITAEFPNANDVTSIREAILSLPNIASQYVHQR